MKVQLITDGSADLPKGFAEKHNIIVVPLNIHFGEEEIRTDELSVDEYYKKCELRTICRRLLHRAQLHFTKPINRSIRTHRF